MRRFPASLHRWITTTPLMVFLLLPCGVLHAEPGVAEWVAALDQASPHGAGLPAADRSVSIGHLEVSFADGRLYPILAGERIVGSYFRGKGEFAYSSAEPLESATFRTNVKRSTGYKPDAGKIAGSVPQLILWGSERAGLQADESWPDGESSAEAVETFAQFRAKRSNDWAFQPELFLAQMFVEAPTQPSSVVELGATKNDLIHVYDVLRDAEERLICMDKINEGPGIIGKMRVPWVISAVPIGRGRLDPPPVPFRLVDVDLQLSNPAGQTAVLEIEETYEFLQPTRTLNLALISRRVAESMEFPYTLESVATADGAPVEFFHRKNSLVLQLAKTATPGERLTLTFHTRGDILYRPQGDNYWRLGTPAWLPLPSRLDMQFFTYRATVQVPEPFVSFSLGKTVRRWNSEGFAWAEFRSEQPVLFPVILAGRYRAYEKSHEGVTIQVHSYAQPGKGHPEGIANNLFAMIEFYAKLLGDYPYEELKVIEINQLGWAQAPPGIIFITKEAFRQGGVTRGWSMGINSRLAHELAHTWWGDTTPWATPWDQWLSESTADYYAELAMEQLWRKSEFDQALKEWANASRFVGDTGSLFAANQLAYRESYRDRRALLYSKGPLVLHALRREMGDDVFFTAMKTILTNHRYKPVHTRDAIEIINWVGKRDFSDWANRYLFGTEFPDPGGAGSKKSSR